MVKVSIKEGGLPRLVIAPSTWRIRPPAPSVKISLLPDPNDWVHFLSSSSYTATKFNEACTDRGILSLATMGDRGDPDLRFDWEAGIKQVKEPAFTQILTLKGAKIKCRSQRSRARLSKVE